MAHDFLIACYVARCNMPCIAGRTVVFCRRPPARGMRAPGTISRQPAMNDTLSPPTQKQKSRPGPVATSAPPSDSSELRHLLTSFDVQSLGEGDEVMGMNLLAAMAVTLANIARPGIGLMLPDERIIPVGCDLLASGPLLSPMTLDNVVAPVARSQANLLGQLARFARTEKQQRGSPECPVVERPQGAGERSLATLMTVPEGEMISPSPEHEWLRVLDFPPTDHFFDYLRSPRFFIGAPNPVALQQQLPAVLQGQALVAIGLNHAAEVGRFGSLCPSLMDGIIPAGAVGETVRGRLLVTDRAGILGEVARTPREENAWLSRLVWLVEGSAGPELPPRPAGDGEVVRLSSVSVRFQSTVPKILANRINSHKPKWLAVKAPADHAAIQSNWMSFLAGMERSLPGISGVARELLVSLQFGLDRIVDDHPTPKGFRLSIRGVESLARHLIHRMANTRAELLFSAREAVKLRQKRRILAKLADGRLDTRSIYHPLHLPAATCQDLLAELQEDNLVRRCGRKWERLEGAALPAPAETLHYDV